MAFLKIGSTEKNATVALSDDRITYFTEHRGHLQEAESRQTAEVGFLRTRNHWFVLDYTGYKTSVNGLRVADCKELHENTLIQIGNASIQLLQEIKRESVTDDSTLLSSKFICFYDLLGFKPGHEVIYCPICEAVYHIDCWEALKQTCARCSYEAPPPG